jgi:hypothetical protein
VIGYRGLAAGAELETNATLSQVKDFNIGLQYARRDAFTVSATTERNMSSIVLAPLINLGTFFPSHLLCFGIACDSRFMGG